MFKHNKTSSAKVVDGSLILSLPDAKTPVVWRMALGEARAAALEVREGADAHTLVLKYPKGDTIDIAPFESKDKALGALMAVSRAMQSATGKTAGAAQPDPERPAGGAGWKWLIPLILIILAVFLFSRTAALVPVDYTAGQETSTSPGGAATDGVPQSADRFLGGM